MTRVAPERRYVRAPGTAARQSLCCVCLARHYSRADHASLVGGAPAAEMAAELSQALGEEVTYYAMPWDQYRALGFPGADDLGNMKKVLDDWDEKADRWKTSGAAWARKFGVSPSTIYMLRRGETWRHLKHPNQGRRPKKSRKRRRA